MYSDAAMMPCPVKLKQDLLYSCLCKDMALAGSHDFQNFQTSHSIFPKFEGLNLVISLFALKFS